MAVSTVVGVLIFVVVPAIAQLIVQLCLQAILHEFGDGFLKQALDVIHAADVCQLQQFTDFCTPRVFFGVRFFLP